MDAAVRALRGLIAERTGIWVPDSRITQVETAAAAARAVAREHDTQALLEHLRRDATASSRAWLALIERITVPESYFNRDAIQMAMLERHLLPELIARNEDRRTLRVWSAGCSTGEEPYSLAMIVAGLLPDRHRWDVLILGTDINPQYLRVAEDGVYGERSFRQVPLAQRERWFETAGHCWRVRAGLREMVRFERGNLVADHWPDPAGSLHDMDLIVCRNVFIYFDAAATADVVTRFGETLVPGGFLVTGHMEVLGVEVEALTPRMLGESLALQRTDGQFADRRVDVRRVEARRSVDKRPSDHRDVENRRRATARRTPMTEGRRIHDPAPAAGEMDALLTAAMHAADIGALAEARQHAQRANALDILAIAPYRTLAVIAELMGDAASARAMLSKVFYLDPKDVDACLTLAALEEKEGHVDRARSLRTHADVLLAGGGAS